MPFASTFRRLNTGFKKKFPPAERACKDQIQKHRESFKGTFVALNPEAANEPFRSSK
jgi:hypothetical protein